MLTVADQLAWESLPEETRQLAERIFGQKIERLVELEATLESSETEIHRRDTMQMHAVDEIKRIETAIENAQTLYNTSIKEAQIMLRGLKARLAP